MSDNQNKSYNNNISNSSRNEQGKIDTPLSRKKNNENFDYFTKLNSKFQGFDSKDFQKAQNSSKRFALNCNFDIMNSPSKKNIKNKNERLRNSNIIINNRERRKSYQAISIFKYKKEKDKDENLKVNKIKLRKTGEFFKPGNKEEKNTPFPKVSYGNVRNAFNDASPTPGVRSPVHHKQGSPTHSLEKKNNNKKPSFEIELKSIKRIGENTPRNIIMQKSKLVSIFQNHELTPKNILNYLCMCKEEENNIYVLNKFKNKLLSEEYLYILHINMFIFKEKFGCKSNLSQELLLEELYNDYLF